MVIGIDLRVLGGGAYGGIAQYLLGLLPELFKLDSNVKFKLFFSGRNAKIRPWISKKIEPWLEQGNVRLFQFNLPNRLLFASSRFFNYPKLDYLIHGADVFFSPHFFSAPLSDQCHSVITFHDLSFIRYPEFFSWRKNFWHRFEMNPRGQAQRADKIIAVSQSTKNDLIGLFGIEEKKIAVVYSGVYSRFDLFKDFKVEPLQVKKKYNLPENFFLFLGVLEPRKNILGILKAFSFLKSGNQIPQDAALVVAGPKGWMHQDLFRFLENSRYRKSVHFIGPVKEEDKLFLYRSAKVFVYPSFFEGFGFPPLEAIAAGVPVVTSRVSSLPEVAGDASLLVDPYNIREMAEAMKNLFEDENLRQVYIEKGLQRVKEFSWKKTAKETLEILLSTS